VPVDVVVVPIVLDLSGWLAMGSGGSAQGVCWDEGSRTANPQTCLRGEILLRQRSFQSAYGKPFRLHPQNLMVLQR